MALFVITCWDKPGALDERLKNRPDHIAYLKTVDSVIRIAGPQLDDAGTPCGSLFVVEVDDLDAAKAFNAGDPFVQRGVFGKVDIRGFTATMGSWKPA
jgi:uncharacterized protein YciI